MKTKKSIIYITACFLSIFIICVWSAEVSAYILQGARYTESVSVRKSDNTSYENPCAPHDGFQTVIVKENRHLESPYPGLAELDYTTSDFFNIDFTTSAGTTSGSKPKADVQVSLDMYNGVYNDRNIMWIFDAGATVRSYFFIEYLGEGDPHDFYVPVCVFYNVHASYNISSGLPLRVDVSTSALLI